MVNFCSGFNCASSSDVQKELIFHKFPLNNKERLTKWIHVVRRKDFKPNSSSFLCSLHFTENDYNKAVISGKLVLKKCAVPSIFQFPKHLIPKVKERRILKKSIEIQDKLIAAGTSDGIHDAESQNKTFIDIGVQTKLSGDELDRTLNNLRRDKRILQQKLNRRDKRVSNMQEMVRLLKNNNLIEETVEDILNNQFKSSLPITLFKNEILNTQNPATCRPYSEEIREYCLTFHFYSPRAYEFIRQISTLPDPSTIRRWLATRHCEPGILHEVIEYFKLKMKYEASKFSHLKDVALIYDTMSIRDGFRPEKKAVKFMATVILVVLLAQIPNS